jgi:oligoribonuclease NrnB/cAMP/cGMP phosphodiesterase (DHH superfamily)
MAKILCIYHGNCDDGFAAAWIVRQRLGNEVEFFPGIYQAEPPDVTGRDVLLVDFSYKRPVLERMAAKAHSILILDHHKTAQEDLSGFLTPPSWEAWLYGQLSTSTRVTALFDMQRSGAGMAADYFEIDRGVRPDFVDYIQDGDLWRKSLPGGDEFTIALRSYPQEFVVWDELARDPEKLIDEGKAIQRYLEAIRRQKRGRIHGCRSQMENGRCPIKLEDYHSAEEKKKWKIVRLDNYTEVEGDIVTADEDSGECSLHVGGETKKFAFPGGIRIISRGR